MAELEEFLAGFKIKPLRYAWLDPQTLAEHPRNPKRHPDAQLAGIADSLERFGWLPSHLALYNQRAGRLKEWGIYLMMYLIISHAGNQHLLARVSGQAVTLSPTRA